MTPAQRIAALDDAISALRGPSRNYRAEQLALALEAIRENMIACNAKYWVMRDYAGSERIPCAAHRLRLTDTLRGTSDTSL